MLTPYIDLHLHSTRSDGALPPQQLIDRAREAGIRVLAITDHNTTEDLTALRAANPDMQLIQGAEISCRYAAPDGQEKELHVVGLGFDPTKAGIRQVLSHNQPDRRPYVNAILDRLRECGIDLGSYEDLRRKHPESLHIGRKQIAEAMVDAGFVGSCNEAFERYIGASGEKRAYVANPLQFVSLEEAVAAVLDAGGIPVLCHLHYYELEPAQEEALVRYFRELAGEKAAMEVYYCAYSQELRLYLLRLSQKYGLMPSAASDYHGQDAAETLSNRFSYASCQKILNTLGITVQNAVPSFPIFVLSGFSGVGKNTVLDRFRQKDYRIFGKTLGLVTSYTTRKPRYAGENYHFVSPDVFQKMAEANTFLEFNEEYSSSSYGTPIQGVMEAVQNGTAVCLEIDCTGTRNLLTGGRVDPEQVLPVFLAVSAEELYHRLTVRNSEDRPHIFRRLKRAVGETGVMASLYRYVLINDDIDRVAEQLQKAFSGELQSSETFDAVQFCADMQCIFETRFGEE